MDSKWYLYFSSGPENDFGYGHPSSYVLENASPDPFEGTWELKGESANADRDGQITDRPSYTLAMEQNSLLVIVSMNGKDAAVSIQSLLTICNEALAMANNFQRYRLNMGISTLHRDVLTLSQAYREAREALKGSFYSDNPVVVYSPHANQAITPVTLPHHVADQIAEYLQRGQKELATHELDHLLERYRKQPRTD
ncbi:hypothetical protein [Paenibacillus phocaensis]|uniref:hypothetical protein n=1 Tax=Paenibacillus phocaensis TaxID=1776378 RepID=UPI000839C326|nr:hypothetical protein [Paenibacillus phocaensis]